MLNSLLVFGGGELQISIINTARQMGFYTIVIDPNPNAYGKLFADKFIVVGADDYKNTLNIAKKYNVKGLVTSSTDNPILMMCRIAEQLKLPFPSYDSCEVVLDKGKFKEILKRNKIAHATGATYSCSDRIDESKFSYPVIIKPLSNSGSRGVIKCEIPEKLQKSINETLEFCRDERFIIEEFIEGDELSVEAIVYNNKVDIIQITDKIVSAPPYNVEIGHIQPSKYMSSKTEIYELLQKIIDITGLNNCAIHPELKTSNGKFTIIEIGPRLGGDFISSKLVPLSTSVNMEKIVINIAIGQSYQYDVSDKAALISYLNLPSTKEVKGVLSESELIKTFPNITEIKNNLKVGEVTKIITNSLTRYGYFILHGEKSNELIKLSESINHFIQNKLLNIQN